MSLAEVDGTTLPDEVRGQGPPFLMIPATPGTVRTVWKKAVWKKAVQAAGLALPLRIHDLRHAHASWLLADGADLRVVKERLGHASTATTERYLHTLPDADDTALDALRRVRAPHGGPPRRKALDPRVRGSGFESVAAHST